MIKEEKVQEFLSELKERFKKGEETMPIEFPKIVLDYNKIIDKLAKEKFGEKII